MAPVTGRPMDWARLKELPAWLPTTELPEPPVHLKDRLFRVAGTQYLICPPHNERFERVPSIPGFVGYLLWASHDGAARRAALMEVEADTSDARPDFEIPPPELLLPGNSATYGAVLREAKTGRHGRCLESASYRVGTDGAFVHRSIGVGPYTFFFRNRKDDPSDPCYAIEYLCAGVRGAAEYVPSAEQGES